MTKEEYKVFSGLLRAKAYGCGHTGISTTDLRRLIEMIRQKPDRLSYRALAKKTHSPGGFKLYLRVELRSRSI
jgi:hypothetical protein